MKNCFQSAAAGKHCLSISQFSFVCCLHDTFQLLELKEKKKKKGNFLVSIISMGGGVKKKKKSKGASPAKAKSRVFKDLLHSQAELRQRLMHRTALEVVAAAAAALPAASSAGWPLQSDKFIVNHTQLSK